MVLQLRDYQEECVRRHYDFFARDPKGHPLFVVPTGGGKSLILSEFVKRSVRAWPKTRFLVVTHVKELIRQNYEEFVGHWGGSLAPAGIYSAGVGRRDLGAQVLFAGIQSMYDKARALGRFDLVLVDEAHLVPKKGMGRYRQYLEDLREVNPDVRVCGYTATHFRLDGGYLHRGDDGIFTDVAYEVPLELLIEQGYLVPLVAKRPEHVIDTRGVGTAAGDFKRGELEDAAMAAGCVEAAVAEVVKVAAEQGRRHWLFFCTGVDHALEVASELENAHGVDVEVVLGRTPKEERDRHVRRFRAGELTALVNVGVLTTGFNAPCCDLMAVMRPTKSAALYVQIMGRGMRTHPGKVDCLVLDYGENVERHGPVNRVRPRHHREVDGEEKPPPPMKFCPRCRTIVMLGTRTCPTCLFEWDPLVMSDEHERVASWLSPVDLEANRPRVHAVDSWHFRRHEKEGKPPSLRVDLMCGIKTVSEWVCIEHGGYPGRKADRWWVVHGGAGPIPRTVDEAIERRRELRRPRAVEVVDDGDFERVNRSLFEPQEAAGP